MTSRIDEDLVRCAAAGSLEAVRSLLASGADPNATVGDARIETHRTALDMAALHGHIDVAEALLIAGCRMDTGENGGTTALTFALLNGNIAIANLLYRFGARGDLLIGFCFTDNYAAIHEILYRQPQRWREYANDAVRSGNIEMLRENLRRNPLINPREDGFRLLRSTIFQWRLVHRWGLKGQGVDDGFDHETFQRMGLLLLEWGADPNSSGPAGESLLHVAASYGRDWSPTEDERIAHSRQLVDRGANVNVRDARTSVTPVTWALQHGKTHLAVFLRDRGGLE
jgi:ankyrin repeat protein